MLIIMVFLIALPVVSLQASDTALCKIPLVETACALNHDTYVQLHPQQKSEYARAIADALNHGTLKPQDIIDRASCSLRHDVTRCCFLSYGKHIDLNTEKVSFPLRMLIEHKRLNRAVTPQGELDLSHLHIADLDGIDAIPNIQSVHTLNLSHNEISLLNPSNFKHLPALKRLNLSFNNLSSIRPKTFIHVPHLNALYLDHNHITHLDQDTFIGLTHLRKLSIPHNKIEWIAIGAFNDLTHTKLVDLSNNQLQLISPQVLTPFANVKKLNISHNNFKIIHSQVLHPLRKLEHLDASHNHITRITDDALYGLKKLETLNLGNNQILMVDFKTPHIFPNLSALVLGNNPIKNKHLSMLRTQMPNVKILQNAPQSSVKQVALAKP